jgi:hypothetical protein
VTADRRALLAWGIPAVLVIAISVVLTQRSSGGTSEPQPARFSGSSVVLAMPSLLAPAQLPARTRVAVVRDAAAAEFYPSPANLDTIVHIWRDALISVGADARIVSSARVLSETAADVLVIPASPCLTVATREAIERAGARGQGLIVTGAPGTHDAGCREIGYGLLVALTGASRAATVSDRPIVYVAVPYSGPLSADVPPGARIDVRPGSQIALRGAARDAVYSGYDLRPAPVEDRPLLDGALSHGEYRGARVVYWGFEPRDVVKRPWNDAVLQLLVRNSVAWSAGLPLSEVEPWPANRQAAVLLAQDVDERFTNARFAADSLLAIGVPGTFFVTSGLADGHRRIVEALEDAGEVGSHADHRGLLGGSPVDEQQARLRATQRHLTGLIGRLVSGLRPPQEQFDQVTMVSWLEAGGDYLFGPNGARSVSPELLDFSSDTLVLIPRTAVDDIAVLEGSSRNARVAEGWFSDDFAHVRALGGVYTLSYHSHLLSNRQYVPILARLARGFASDSTVWIATGAEIASWWQARASLNTEVERVASRTLRLTIRNRGWMAVSGAVVRMSLPPGTRVTIVDGELLPSEAGVARLALPRVEPEEVRTVSLTLAAADAP